ncbi:MAG: OB-fold domain-containing protein [Halioglobus sp.]|nr:OB-fold domain-containing protein [Halioglobus sp.]
MANDVIPLPRPTALSEPHWNGCREGILRVQQCQRCKTCVFIPQPCCTHCQSNDLNWLDCSGKGKVYSHTTVHRAPRPQFEVPYVVAIIELEEGWHMLSNVLGCPVEDVHVNMPVCVEFREITDEITLPYFVPTR